MHLFGIRVFEKQDVASAAKRGEIRESAARVGGSDVDFGGLCAFGICATDAHAIHQ